MRARCEAVILPESRGHAPDVRQGSLVRSRRLLHHPHMTPLRDRRHSYADLASSALSALIKWLRKSVVVVCGVGVGVCVCVCVGGCGAAGLRAHVRVRC